jgi:hypothetical protein
MFPTVRAARHLGFATLGAVIASAAVIASLAAQQPITGPAKPGGNGAAVEPAKTGHEHLRIEAHFRDGSMLKLTVLEERIEMVTPYGRLSIPATDIRHIDFGIRPDAATGKRVEAAIAGLRSPDPREREAATAALLDLGEFAFPALVEAAKSKDAEVAQRAEAILNKLRETIPSDRLEHPANDVIETADSKFTGRISAEVFKVKTAQFGDQQMKLGDLICLGSKKSAEPEAVFVDQPLPFGPGIGGQPMPGWVGPGGLRPVGGRNGPRGAGGGGPRLPGGAAPGGAEPPGAAAPPAKPPGQ